ncbi:hypothetical protein HWV62_35919 [Athelia sp. TMB]|nr:hypothetical protein HWV62_35919 [Athelia sp. TMB]
MMALGATSSDIVTTRHVLQSPDGPIRVTSTKLSFEFVSPGIVYLPYLVPEGYTLHEASIAMLTGELPLPRFPTPVNSPQAETPINLSRSRTPANSARADSPISLSTGSPPPSPEPGAGDNRRSCSPHPEINDTTLYNIISEVDLFDKDTDPGHARRARRALRRATPPENRWYCVTRGLRVGVI